MKIVFFGTPAFAASILEHIVENSHHEVVAVVSKPDARRGRGQHFFPTPVKEWVSSHLPGVPILQPPKASRPEVVEQLRAFQADIFLVIAYGEILSFDLLQIPPLGCYNIHASLLPAYRGAAPIQRALMDGCTSTGISIIKMSAKMDSGDIVWQGRCEVGSEVNAEELTALLLHVACSGIINTLDLLEKRTSVFCPQHSEEATLAPKIVSDDLVLDPTWDVMKLHDRVRALSPHPGAFFYVELREKKTRLKVLKTHVDVTACENIRRWRVSENGKLELASPTGTLVLDVVQTEGKSLMSSDDFLRGAPLHELYFL